MSASKRKKGKRKKYNPRKSQLWEKLQPSSFQKESDDYVLWLQCEDNNSLSMSEFAKKNYQEHGRGFISLNVSNLERQYVTFLRETKETRFYLDVKDSVNKYNPLAAYVLVINNRGFLSLHDVPFHSRLINPTSLTEFDILQMIPEKMKQSEIPGVLELKSYEPDFAGENFIKWMKVGKQLVKEGEIDMILYRIPPSHPIPADAENLMNSDGAIRIKQRNE